MIRVDIPNRRLDLKISQEEIDERMKNWQAPEPKIKDGYLSIYSRLVTSAHYGAIIK